MTAREARIHVGLKRYHARRRQAIDDVRTPRYEPLNPETCGKPAPEPLPFTPHNPSPETAVWLAKRKARIAAEERASEPSDAPGVVCECEGFKVFCEPHWAEPRLCYRVVDARGWHVMTVFSLEAAQHALAECVAWKAVMAGVKTFNHALEALEPCPF